LKNRLGLGSGDDDRLVGLGSAAFNVADGTVISELHRRRRAAEFKKFLATSTGQCPKA
jgi:hypothetical protein